MNVYDYRGDFHKEKFERLLTEKINKPITLKTKSLYVDERIYINAKIFVDGKDSGINVDFDDLTEYEKHGILNFKLNQLVRTIKETL